jgi:hypothetical protein
MKVKRKHIDYKRAFNALIPRISNTPEKSTLKPGCLRLWTSTPSMGIALSCGGRYQIACRTCNKVTKMYLLSDKTDDAELEWNLMNPIKSKKQLKKVKNEKEKRFL